MKMVIAFLILVPTLVFAQKVDLKDLDGADDTTIEISKGKKAAGKCEAQYEVVEGSNNVIGEAQLTGKEATAKWSEACAKWTKQFRADNKENIVINIDCGKADCTSEASGKVCSSTAVYKVKTKLN